MSQTFAVLQQAWSDIVIYCQNNIIFAPVPWMSQTFTDAEASLKYCYCQYNFPHHYYECPRHSPVLQQHCYCKYNIIFAPVPWMSQILFNTVWHCRIWVKNLDCCRDSNCTYKTLTESYILEISVWRLFPLNLCSIELCKVFWVRKRLAGHRLMCQGAKINYMSAG